MMTVVGVLETFLSSILPRLRGAQIGSITTTSFFVDIRGSFKFYSKHRYLGFVFINCRRDIIDQYMA